MCVIGQEIRMSATEISEPVPQVPERITIVLKAQEGSTLEQVCQFVSLGMPVAIGRGMAVIAGASDEDLQMVLGEERDDRKMQAKLQQQALGAPTHLAAHAQEMFDLLRRIDAKCGGLDAALGHGIEPSEQMWTESREAMEAIWELQDKILSAASVDKSCVNQTAETSESVNQQQNALQNISEIIPETGDSLHIDDRVRMAANSRRYEWLRDEAFSANNQILVRDHFGNLLTKNDLDREIDRAKKSFGGMPETSTCAD